MGALWRWFAGFAWPAKVVMGLFILFLAVVFSPVVAMLAGALLLVSLVVMGLKLLRGRPARSWGIAVAGSLVLAVAFSGVSQALYGGTTEQASAPEETTEQTERPRAEPTQEAASEEAPERVEEARRNETAAAPAPEPSPEPVPERAPDPVPPAPEPEEPAFDATATVTRVVDGDTIEISPAINGITDVRLIGMDTPETKEPGCSPQPLGAEASAFAESYLSGQEVELEFDQERTDQYDRLLAYVYLPSGEMFNETLLEEGYAQAYPYPPNVKYADRFEEAQARARAADLGIWGLAADQLALLTDRGNGIGADGCAPLTPEPSPQYEPPSPEPTPEPGPLPEPEFAPDPSISGYPPFPGDPNGSLTCGDVPPGPYSVPAGSDRDGDGDGVACE